MTPIKEDEKPSILCCKVWLIKILIAMFTTGTGLFIYATHFSDDGIIA